MAKPIEPTPTLYGKDAIRFLKMVEEEQKNPTPARVKLIKEALKTKFHVRRVRGLKT